MLGVLALATLQGEAFLSRREKEQLVDGVSQYADRLRRRWPGGKPLGEAS